MRSRITDRRRRMIEKGEDEDKEVNGKLISRAGKGLDSYSKMST
jgi:hypothetical protein